MSSAPWRSRNKREARWGCQQCSIQAGSPEPGPHHSLSLCLCPRPAARTPGPRGRRGPEPRVHGGEASGSAERSGRLAVPPSREPRGAPSARPVRPAQPPDPRTPGRRAGAAGEGPVGLQLELVRPALRQTTDGAAWRRGAALSTDGPAVNSPSTPPARGRAAGLRGGAAGLRERDSSFVLRQ